MAKEVKIKVSGETSKYEKSMRNVKRTTKKTAKHFTTSWTSATKKVSSRIFSLKSAFIGLAVYGVARVVSNFETLSGVQEKAEAGMLAAMKSMGRYTEGFEELIKQTASGIQTQSTFGDEAVLMGTKFLMTYSNISNEAMPRVMKAMTDLSALMKGDFTSAANMLGKASMGMVGELRKAGITVDSNTFKAEGFIGVLKQIEVQVKGQAAALRATKAGGLESFGNVIGDVKEKFGLFTSTIKSNIARVLLPKIEMLNKKLAEWIGSGQMESGAKSWSDVIIAAIDKIEKKFEQVKKKVNEHITEIKKMLETIWTIASYDPAIIKYGLIGLIIFGRKGAVIMGGMAHMVTWATNLAQAFRNLEKGIVSFKEIAMANFKELEELAERGGIGQPDPWGGPFPEPKAAPAILGYEAGVSGAGAGGGGEGEPEPWEHAKSIAEQVVSSWNEVISDSQTLGLSYFFRRDQALLEVDRQNELERLRIFGEQRIELNQTEHDVALWMMQQRQAKELAIEEHTRKMRKWGQQQLVDNVIKTGKLIMDISGKQNKALFRAVQVVSAGKAAIYAYQSAAKAMAEVPWPLNVAVAASNLAFGMAQVAAIMAQSPGGGAAAAGVPAVSTSTAPVYAPYPGGAMAGTEARATTNIYIQGDFVGEEIWIDYLIEKLNQAGQDRDVYVYASHARTAEELGY